jgi:hypothetical protein
MEPFFALKIPNLHLVNFIQRELSPSATPFKLRILISAKTVAERCRVAPRNLPLP